MLAGGRSRRMGSDKAFLEYKGKPFIWHIVKQMSHLSNEVYVVIGDKSEDEFKSLLGDFPKIKILNDSRKLSSPLGGLLTAFETVKSKHVIAVGCDMPLVKPEILRFIYESKGCDDYSVVPIWENGQLEPLLALYEVKESREASLWTIARGKLGCKDMISLLQRVRFLPIASLRKIDPSLQSLQNVNSEHEYAVLKKPSGDKW
ncbi:MAG: molybdenum cofactor guanylyltransferase [Nitrososphaerales archaeon]